MVGITPSNKWRSEPQIAHAVTLMMASRPSWILGSGTVSQRMSFLPCQVSAFIGFSASADTNLGETVCSYSALDKGTPSECKGDVLRIMPTEHFMSATPTF